MSEDFENATKGIKPKPYNTQLKTFEIEPPKPKVKPGEWTGGKSFKGPGEFSLGPRPTPYGKAIKKERESLGLGGLKRDNMPHIDKWQSYEGCDETILSQIHGRPNKTAKFLQEAAENGVNHTSAVYRGRSFKIVPEVGDELENACLQSFSKRKRVAFDFAADKDNGTVVELIAGTRKRFFDIDKISGQFLHEHEVIVPKGARYKVLSKKMDSNTGIWHITAKEIF
jgi:hypothetical protein